MVDITKREIESNGFCQIIRGTTWTWKQQTDSLLDQVWTNCGEFTVRHFNDARSVSDHNVVGVVLSTKKMKMAGKNIRRRSWKDFNEKRCVDKFKNMDWSDILSEGNVDVANSLFEEIFLSIIESEAPMRTIQVRSHYARWLSVQTKDLIKQRDLAWMTARQSGLDSDWQEYRHVRNCATNHQRKDKASYLRQKYDRIEETHDTGKLFSYSGLLLSEENTGCQDVSPQSKL